MGDESIVPQPTTEPVVSGAPPAPSPVESEPTVAEPETAEAQVSVESDHSLATELEAAAQHSIERAYQIVEDLEAEKNRAAESIASFTTGLLHSDTKMVTAPKVGDEGPRQEQVHTNL